MREVQRRVGRKFRPTFALFALPVKIRRGVGDMLSEKKITFRLRLNLWYTFDGWPLAATESGNPIKEKERWKKKVHQQNLKPSDIRRAAKLLHLYVAVRSANCHRLCRAFLTMREINVRAWAASVTCSSAERTVLKRRDEETTRNDAHRAWLLVQRPASVRSFLTVNCFVFIV